MLRDQQLVGYAVVAPDTELTSADDGNWFVVIDEDGTPIAAVAPDTVATKSHTGPFTMNAHFVSLISSGVVPLSTVVAAADLDVDSALSSPAFAELDADSAVVLVHDNSIVGVWAGESLASGILHGPSQVVNDTVLPGPPQIPVIARFCKYLDGTTACGSFSSFETKPFPMPPCPNVNGFSAHQFVW